MWGVEQVYLEFNLGAEVAGKTSNSVAAENAYGSSAKLRQV